MKTLSPLVSGVRNPISLARAVISTPHVFLIGEGAINLAIQLGCPMEPPEVRTL